MSKLISRVLSLFLLSSAVFFIASQAAAQTSPIDSFGLTDLGPSDNTQEYTKRSLDFTFDKFSLEFRTFILQVANGQADTITGIYVQDTFALDVTQQPSGSPGYISPDQNTVTEFGMAQDYGTIGMLAHNYLAGDLFFQLQDGQVVYLVFGNREIQKFTIVDVLSYQALQPNSPYSNFLNLENSEEYLTATDLFYQVYAQDGALVLQTCIENEGLESWGRLFIIAEPGSVLSVSG